MKNYYSISTFFSLFFSNFAHDFTRILAISWQGHNRTSVELKLKEEQASIKAITGHNRTSVELKQQYQRRRDGKIEVIGVRVAQ